MLNAAETALFLGLLTALLGRLPKPYVSSVWCAIVSSSVGLWLIAGTQTSSFFEALALGTVLQFAFSFSFITAASAFEHAADAVTTRRERG
jgi:hypothetical protein